MIEHKQGCDALGGYGHGVGPCTCGAVAPVDLHQQIMNLPCKSPQTHSGYMSAYNAGHRDARHAAAQLVAASPAAGVPTDLLDVETVPAHTGAADRRTYVTCHQCDRCEHIGINDAHPTDAACNACGWSGPSPQEDVCPGCDERGTMCEACPKCGGRYRLLADVDLVLASPAAPVGAPTARMLTEDETMDAYNMPHVDGEPYPHWIERMDATVRKFCEVNGIALLSRQGCELATDATKQLREPLTTRQEIHDEIGRQTGTEYFSPPLHSVHPAATPIDQDFRMRPDSSEAAPSTEVLVPREPTAEMLDAASRKTSVFRADARRVWSVMLAAAPKE